MKKIRRGVFETNSSSMHSIAVMKCDKPIDMKELAVYTREDGTSAYEGMRLWDGIWTFMDDDLEFGRYPFKILFTFPEKVRYALANAYSAECGETEWVRQIKEIVKETVPEFEEFEFPKERKWWAERIGDEDAIDDEADRESEEGDEEEVDYYGNIDHQSYALLHTFLKKEGISIRDFLLNDKYIVIIDGDEYCDFSRYCKVGIIDTSKIDHLERGNGWDPEWQHYLEEHPELKGAE